MVVMAVAQHRRRKYARITQIFILPQMRKLSEETRKIGARRDHDKVLVSASLMRRPSARLAPGVRGHRIICSAVNINGPDEQIQIDLLRLRPAAARRFGAAL
jgi:hypothetical protein